MATNYGNIKAERAFMLGGKTIPAGTILVNQKLDDGEIQNCLASGRAKITTEKPKDAPAAEPKK